MAATATKIIAPPILASEDHRAKVQTLFSYLTAQGQGDYIGESISQLEHSLQAAALASSSGADDATVLAALLHDVGRFIPAAKDLPRMIAADGTYVGTESHEAVGEKYLCGLGFPREVYEVVGAHVWAKRYLCATEPGYWEALSKSSKASLVFQVRERDYNTRTYCV
jgi:predicted HD phosphohydrolase